MNINPTQLVITNIGKLAGTQTIEINKPLILFYGEIKQGKSTILNCVRWVCGGEFPDDIISHGAKEGSIELRFEGGMIGRSFYKAKDSETKARAVVFVRNGKPVHSPVTEIKRFLNPFLLDQDFLRNKSELERKQYFTELFAVDTTELDTELFNNQRDATALRSKIIGYGEIDLTEVKPVDVEALTDHLDKIKGTNKNLEDVYEKECEKYNERLNFRSARILKRDQLQGEVDELNARLSKIKLDLAATVFELDESPVLTEPKEPATASTDAFETKLREAGATNERAKQYQANKKRSDTKAADEKSLTALEKRGREIKAEKQSKLKSIGETCGIKGLEFDEAGNFIYQGTTAGMISDSQIMRLSSELSALYPEGFGLDLIDRAESLGKSIFEFVDRAKAEKKTIMATIVGERPANVDPEIGVWVVENGKVTP